MSNPVYTYILDIYNLVWPGFMAYQLFILLYMIWFDLVLRHINHCWLFNAKSCLYRYINYIRFGLVGFYGISTIVGYLMPNPLYTYILNISIVIHRQICFVLSKLISVVRQYLPVAGIETQLTQTSTQASNHSATRRY